MRIVVKFGGSSLASADKFANAAKNLKRLRDRGNEVAAVVSAPGDMTNRLMSMGNPFLRGGRPDANFLEYLSLGERKSTYLLSMALEKEGQPSKAITPGHGQWPLIAQDLQIGGQELSSSKENDPSRVIMDDEESEKRFQRHVEPLLREGSVPVISGFFVKTAKGETLALGRGGSDISAFLVGKYLYCDEVLIVTDVDGVLSSDPRYVDGTLPISEITADDLVRLSSSGARVLHPDALRYKTEAMSARIVSFDGLGALELKGTTITGAADTGVTSLPMPLSMISLMGQGLSARQGVLVEVARFLHSNRLAIHSMTQNNTFINLYATEEGEKLLTELHKRFVGPEGFFQNATRKGGVGELTLSNRQFINTPGSIAIISDTLSRRGINILEMVTSLTDIVVYVKYDLLGQCEKLLKRLFVEEL